MADTSVLSFQYAYVYAAINIFCVFSSVLILTNFNSYLGSHREVRLFHRMTTSFLIYLLLEIVWILGAADIVPLSELTTGLVKILGTICIPLMVYYWFWFAESRFKSKLIKERKYRIIFSVPIILMFVLYAVSFFTGWVFKITPQNTVEPGPLIILTGIVDNFYGISIIVHASILTIVNKSYHLRREFLTQILFITICTVSGILDAIISMTPVMTLTISFAIVYLFVNVLEPQLRNVYSDALTGLNNRRCADLYLAEMIEEASPANPFYLFIVDIDHFKRINDTLGHLEGDKALKTVANVIVETSVRFHGFVARWGGDEFLVIIQHEKIESLPTLFSTLLNDRLQSYTDNHLIPYPLAMTLGYYICESSKDEMSSIISAADQMLYKNRQERLQYFKG